MVNWLLKLKDNIGELGPLNVAIVSTINWKPLPAPTGQLKTTPGAGSNVSPPQGLFWATEFPASVASRVVITIAAVEGMSFGIFLG